MRLVSLTLLAALITANSTAAALPTGQSGVRADGAVASQSGAPAGVRQGNGMTLEQAVAQVRRQYNGQIVSAETRVRGGQEIHVIRVLTSDGTVKTVEIPGRRR
jgi:hypothetical protein